MFDSNALLLKRRPAWPMGFSLCRPQIVLVLDVASRQNSCLTPGGTLRLIGRNLTVSGPDPDTGIFFVNENDPKDFVRIPFEKITVNLPGYLSMTLPHCLKKNALYRIKLCSRASANSAYLRRQVQVAWFPRPFSVR